MLSFHFLPVCPTSLFSMSFSHVPLFFSLPFSLSPTVLEFHGISFFSFPQVLLRNRPLPSRPPRVLYPSVYPSSGPIIFTSSVTLPHQLLVCLISMSFPFSPSFSSSSSMTPKPVLCKVPPFNVFSFLSSVMFFCLFFSYLLYLLLSLSPSFPFFSLFSSFPLSL